LGSLIDEMGFGWYQANVWILAGCFFAAEGSFIQTAAGLSGPISDRYHITTESGKSFLMMVVFIGFAIGTCVAGPLGDKYGRRLPMLVGYVGLLSAAAITSCITPLHMVHVMFFMFGIFSGIGVPASYVVMTEVTPSHLRGTALASLGCACSLGEVWSSCGLYLMIPDLVYGPWHCALVWGIIPAVIGLAFSAVSPVSRYDTPHFLEAQGRHADLACVMHLIGEMNGKADVVEAVQIQHQSQSKVDFKGALRMLATTPYLYYSSVIAVMFFAKDMGFFGMSLLWPTAWRAVGVGGVSMANATELLLTCLIGIPGYLLAMGLMFCLPRRVSLSSCAVVCAFSAYLLRYFMMGKAVGLIGVLLVKLSMPTWHMSTIALPGEVFPTQVRVWAYAIMGFVGKLAAIVTPSVLNQSTTWFLRAIFVLACSAALLVWTLPETTGVQLGSVNNHSLTPEEHKRKDCENVADFANYGAITTGSKNSKV